MREGEIVVIDADSDVLIHVKLKRPLVSGWVVELVCENGVQQMISFGHPAFAGYLFWTHVDKILYEHSCNSKEVSSCNERCIFEEESELYKTYGGD